MKKWDREREAEGEENEKDIPDPKNIWPKGYY